MNTLTCKIIAKKGKNVEVEIEGQPLIISKEYLPFPCQEGEELRLYFRNLKAADLETKEMAKYILEEILNGK